MWALARAGTRRELSLLSEKIQVLNKRPAKAGELSDMYKGLYTSRVRSQGLE